MRAPGEDLLRDLEGAVVRGDCGDHVLDVGDHTAARQPDPVPLGLVLAGHPEQTEEEVPLRSPAVLQAVSLGDALPGCVECPAVAGSFPVAGVRDPEEPSSLLHFCDQSGADFRRRRLRGRHCALRRLLRLGRCRGLLLRWRGRSYLWLRNSWMPPTRSWFRPVRMMAVLQVETSRVSDLRLPLPTLLGHGDQAPLLERAGGKRELGTVRRDGVGPVPDAGEERELPVVQRRPRMHGDRRTVFGLLGTSRGDGSPGAHAAHGHARRWNASHWEPSGSRSPKAAPKWLPKRAHKANQTRR